MVLLYPALVIKANLTVVISRCRESSVDRRRSSSLIEDKEMAFQYGRRYCNGPIHSFERGSLLDVCRLCKRAPFDGMETYSTHMRIPGRDHSSKVQSRGSEFEIPAAILPRHSRVNAKLKPSQLPNASPAFKLNVASKQHTRPVTAISLPVTHCAYLVNRRSGARVYLCDACKDSPRTQQPWRQLRQSSPVNNRRTPMSRQPYPTS